MIISKTPMRITLGGGGTDLKSFYSKRGGHVISMAINKFIYISLKPSPDNEFYNLHYSNHEIVRSINKIKHPIIRECLLYFKENYGLNTKFEISSLSDVISGSGLGSSSSYTVGLLNCLFKFINKTQSAKKIAELACHIEIDKLKNPIGKQDQYIASFGSLISLKINRNGETRIKKINKMNNKLSLLIKNTHIYDTKVRRKTAAILQSQNSKTNNNNQTVLNSLSKIKEFGDKTYDVFFGRDNIKVWANTLHEHWELKKSLSNKISLSKVNIIYDRLMKKKKILGGKIIGAGGGGFFLVYSNKNLKFLNSYLQKNNLSKFNYSISLNGSKCFEV